MNEYLSLTSLTSAVLAIFLIAFAISVLRKNPVRWGKPIFVLNFGGLLLCIIVAMRDGYGLRSDAVIDFTGWQATLFSVLGTSILLIGLLALFNRKMLTKSLFITVFGLFMTKLVLMETIRLITIVGRIL